MTEPNKPHEPMSAQERLDLGRSHYEEGKITEAVKVWSNITRDDSPEVYAQAQCNLGNTYYYSTGRLQKAIDAWGKVLREDSPEAYAQAQLDLGDIYKNDGNLEKAIDAWGKVLREDSPEAYAQAQLNLGNTYADHNRIVDAIDAWSKVLQKDNPEVYKKAQSSLRDIYRKDDIAFKPAITARNEARQRKDKDSPEAYAQAQLNLGNVYKNNGNFEKAIDAWSKVLREDDPKAYAQAQFNIGNAYYSTGRLQKAIDAWGKVLREDDPKAYAQAQFNIGNTYYYSTGRLQKAIDAWGKVLREDNPEAYAQAQLNLGDIYKNNGNLEKAIDAWINIQHEDNPEAYKEARSRLRGIYHKNDKELEPVIAAWEKARQPKDNPEAYAQAQLNLGNVYKNNGNLEKAIDAWSKVLREDDPEAYAQAQLNLGNVYKNNGNLEKAKEVYRNVRDLRYYESICSLNIIECPKKVHEALNELYKNVTEILKELQIIPEFEPKVAHYSRSSTAFDLLKNDQPSNFRLSTIRGVNDPTEGTVLGNYFQTQNIYENIHTNNIATFISCFTFNHDSLNQFRLYGKENGIEATGVSLVFKKDFFDNQYSHLGFITHLPFINSCPKLEEPKEPDTPSKPKYRQDKPKIEKVSLYRCIYLDPKSGYLTLSHRDKSTFYLQYKEDECTAKNQWDQYYKEISDKEESVKKHLFRIKELTQNILNTIHEKGCSDKQKEKIRKQKGKIRKTVRSILLPLQYLVKHNAFQEEQECRIMYITHLHNEKIHHYWEKQQVYVEYEESVLPHIDEIYLSPGAAKYQDHFRILLDQGSGKSKVRISQNPFRNKE